MEKGLFEDGEDDEEDEVEDFDGWEIDFDDSFEFGEWINVSYLDDDELEFKK